MSLDTMAQLPEDCVTEAENEPLLGGGEASMEVVASQGSLGKVETLDIGRVVGVVIIELVPSDDSFGDIKGEVLGVGLDWKQ